LPAEIEDRARKIRLAVRRMTNLIDRLLNSLQFFDGNQELYFHPTEIDLFELLHDVCQTYREINPGSHIVEHLRDASRVTMGDPGLLYQAFSNLLSNAVKYSPDGSLVEMKAHAEGRSLVVIVEDRGIGIPRADQDKLFERYHRGGNVKGTVGTGIGLYLVRMVIDLHRGSIQVESAEGKGTRFIVRLPAAAARPA
jgi:signal transduction histidine kinase